MKTDSSAITYRPVNRHNIERSGVWAKLDPALQADIHVVSSVFPFRTNSYLLEELIDWNRVPQDPIFQLTFPQKGMLEPEDYRHMADLLAAKAPDEKVRREANLIRERLNPHPAGQLTHNLAVLDGRPLDGVQHKYDETVLFFPGHAQTCHAYCTFCFRWAQFVGIPELKMASKQTDALKAYLKSRPEVTDLLLTGGDPMFMKAEFLSRYLDALLIPELEHVRNIRIGTKSVAYWPHRYVTDPDADDVLRLFERVVASGRQLAVMGHYNHPVELSTPVAREALRRIRSTGAVVRMQSPLVRHINDDPQVWVDLWRTGARLGAIPYYMFVARNTGAKKHFELPLVRAWEIFRSAYRQVSGLCRTVRGPSMSALPGKIRVSGVSEIGDRKVFVLEYLQARDADLVGRPFFARYDPDATWFSELEPAFERDLPFFPHLSEDDVELQSVVWS